MRDVRSQTRDVRSRLVKIRRHLGAPAMYHLASRVSFALLLLCLFAFATQSAARADDLAKAIELKAKIGQVRDFVAFDDPKMTLQEAIDHLAKKYDVNIDVNERAFLSEEVREVLRLPVAEQPIPALKGTFAQILSRILARVPIPSGATYVIRGDRIEITTGKFVEQEFYSNRLPVTPLPPLVHAAIANAPLAIALRDLARAEGANVVVDVRVAKEAATNVTASFANVPLDTAVFLLADMCGLTSVEVGNVLYVTSKENGRALQQEQEKRRLKGLEKPDASK
jgi:hypothetical protein